MADGFYTKDIDKVISNLLSVFGKENYNKENYKHKIEKTFCEYTYLVTIHKYTLKKPASNIILSCLLP